ncbi:MAG: hypothetical protein CME59_06625 [Halioglobus sp.]|nr:hypothetical protein [Halioglobus sp.]|tara:strand:- start:6637 stop:7020 length:384 start_codon:yes stop_codon:yes gene_type:complete
MDLTDRDYAELSAIIPSNTHILDYRNIDDMRDIWCDEAEFSVNEPAYLASGRDDIIAMLSLIRSSHPEVRHVVTTSWIRVDDEVVIESYLQIFNTTAMMVTMFARYRDTGVRTPVGWRIAKRTCPNG